MKRLPLPASPRDRRALLLGLVAVAVALLLRVLPPALRSARTVHERAGEVARQLATARSLIAHAPALRDSLAARGRRLVALAPRFVAGATAADAGAELAGIVGAAARRHQVRILRQESRPDTAAGAFPHIVMRFDAEGDIAGVSAWLGEIESGATLLDATELSIDAPGFAAPPSQPEVLHVGLTVSGLRVSRRGE